MSHLEIAPPNPPVVTFDIQKMVHAMIKAIPGQETWRWSICSYRENDAVDTLTQMIASFKELTLELQKLLPVAAEQEPIPQSDRYIRHLMTVGAAAIRLIDESDPNDDFSGPGGGLDALVALQAAAKILKGLKGE